MNDSREEKEKAEGTVVYKSVMVEFITHPINTFNRITSQEGWYGTHDGIVLIVLLLLLLLVVLKVCWRVGSLAVNRM
jgi:hypothetical protein